MKITLDNLNLVTAERELVTAALAKAGTILGAAELLGITRHAMKRRMVKHNLRAPWLSSPRRSVPEAAPT
jgi:transcriptional regulator with GAF, ATPase, and Fis domain